MTDINIYLSELKIKLEQIIFYNREKYKTLPELEIALLADIKQILRDEGGSSGSGGITEAQVKSAVEDALVNGVSVTGTGDASASKQDEQIDLLLKVAQSLRVAENINNSSFLENIESALVASDFDVISFLLQNIGRRDTGFVPATDISDASLIDLFRRLLATKLGESITGTTIPTGGSGIQGLLSTILTNLPSATKASLIKTMLRKYKDDFSGTSLSADWTVIQTGAGQSISVISSELRIVTGVTALAEIIIRNNIPFTFPFRLIIPFYISQRIANQEFFIEFVDATGNDKISLTFSGTTTNSCVLNCMTGGVANTGVNNSSFASSSYSLALELEVASDEINLYSRGLNNSSSRGAGVSINRKVPDPNLEYFFQIRVKNTATPASSTTFFLDSILIQDIEELTAEITGGRGGGSGNQTIPVMFSTTPAVNINNTPNVIVNNTFGIPIKEYVINNVAVTAPLIANATYTSSGFNYSKKLKGWVITDQTGTLIVESSHNGSLWRQISSSISVSAGTTEINVELLGAFYRVRYVNGAVAQTNFELTLFGVG